MMLMKGAMYLIYVSAPGARGRRGQRPRRVKHLQDIDLLTTNLLAYGFQLKRTKNLTRPTINLLRRKVFEFRADPAQAPALPPDITRGSDSDDSEDLDAVESSEESTDTDVHLTGGLDSDEEPPLGPPAIINMPTRQRDGRGRTVASQRPCALAC